MTDTGQFDAWMTAIRERVDAVLTTFLRQKRDQAIALSPVSAELVDEVSALTMRGGKRLRPVVTAASFRAVAPDRDELETAGVGAALELLQTYLLIHDDWMDQDTERRGGPAAHFAFAERHNDAHLGASLGVLAGDLASTYSWELFLRGPFPSTRREEALAAFVRLHTEVFAGQQLDLIADTDVERMHDLKTGSYTVRGPAQLGALLADANAEQLRSLEAWARPLGVAFQLRDDLLGTFGSATATGKPGDDLRHGKRNAVIAQFEQLIPREKQGLILRVWGDPEADEATVAEATELLAACGAKARVESRLMELTAQARATLEAAQIEPSGKGLLLEVTDRLTLRRY